MAANGKISAMLPRRLPPSFGSDRHKVQAELNHCGYLGYRNTPIVAILNLRVDLMPQAKFRSIRHMSLRRDVT